MADERSNHHDPRPGHFEVDRVGAVEAYTVAGRLALRRFSRTPNYDPIYPKRLMDSFHSDLIARAAEDTGTITTSLRDSPSSLNKDLTPSVTVLSAGGRPVELFFPIEDPLEAVTEEARKIRARLSRLNHGEDLPETPEELKKRLKRYNGMALILREFSVPPPLPPEGSRPWEDLMEHMADRYHESEEEALNPENKNLSEIDDALWDWYAMGKLARGNIFKPPISSLIVEIPIVDII